jgi:hypothetical protein
LLLLLLLVVLELTCRVQESKQNDDTPFSVEGAAELQIQQPTENQLLLYPVLLLLLFAALDDCCH